MKIHILQNRRKEFHWRAVARNGRTIADGAETYKSHAMVVKGLLAFLDAVRYGEFDIVPPAEPKPARVRRAA